MRGGEVGERVAFQLLDAQRDALALDIDAQHHGLDLVALLEVADSFFAGLVPGQVGQVHQTVDATRQADEHAEVGDGLDGALHAVVAAVVLGELLPRVGVRLLHAQRDAATILVDLQNHDLDLVAQADHLAGVDVLVGPVHFGDVHQTLDARLDLDERAVVGDVGDLAEHAGVLRVATTDADPRIFAQLLDAQRDAVLLLVELEHLGGDFLTDLQHFRRVTDTAPCHVGDVQQTIDAAQVNERTVVGDVLDHALDHGAFRQRLEQLGAFLALRQLDDGTTRQHDVVATAVELDDLELEGLALVGGGVLDRTGVDERTRQESTDTVGHDGQAALDLAGDRTGDQIAGLQGEFQLHPGSQTLGAIARQAGFAEAVLERVDGNRYKITFLNFQLATVVVELLDRHVALGFQAGVDDHVVVIDPDDFGGDHLTLPHLLALEGFLEEGGKAVFRCRILGNFSAH